MSQKFILIVALAILGPISHSTLAMPNKSGSSNEFEFAGFTGQLVLGDVGVLGMHAACQNDFGPDARMCTSREYFRSPNAEDVIGQNPSAIRREAWIHPTFGSNNDFSGINAATCISWKVTTSSGLTVGDDGIFSNLPCDIDRPVTCCIRR